MGLSASKDWKPNEQAARQFRQAEQALLKKYGVKDITTERHLKLSSNPALGGVTFARVLEVNLPVATASQPKANDIPVMFFHGGGGTPCDWLPILPHLVQPGRVVYLVERPGNGLSYPLDYTTVEVADFSAQFVSEVLQALNIRKVHLVGNSFGGGTVVWYANKHPNLSTAVASITLVGTPAGFQGMNVPWVACLVRPWMGTIGGFLAPFFPFIPAFLMGVVLRISLNALSVGYLYYLYLAYCMRHNTESIITMIMQLYPLAHKGKGWKLKDLEHLSLKTCVYVLMGTCEPFISSAQQDEITRCIGAENHIRDIGFGHIPWFADPNEYAITLQRLWAEAEAHSNASESRALMPIFHQSPNAMVCKRLEPRSGKVF
ncbi:hydrolase [Seminavis robusta]|uniref:Hydrolase n=1 Tax=Seminavis robusta TaxID=568900 RepID=A0A9N8HV83_9STRA|nr:hydrolase [Seminavis robusta]|eukprot:Sro1946_g307020.1 hydrolase (375) ;mRNA; r:6691-7815